MLHRDRTAQLSILFEIEPKVCHGNTPTRYRLESLQYKILSYMCLYMSLYVGSRISKNWFIVRPIRETQYSVPYLLTMVNYSYTYMYIAVIVTLLIVAYKSTV